MPVWLDVVLAIATASGTIAVAIVGWIQLGRLTEQFRLQGQRESKWKTLEACRSIDVDPIIDRCSRVLAKHWDPQAAQYHNIDEVKFEAITILNVLDEIAIGIRQGIYDESIAYDHIRSYVAKAVVSMILPNKSIFLVENYEYLIWLHNQWSDDPSPEPRYVDPETER